MWGPYPTPADAKKAAGIRHTVITGGGLSDGQVMTRGALRAALQSGRIRTADGADPWALA